MLTAQIQEATEQHKSDLSQTAKVLQETATALRAEADRLDQVIQFLVGPSESKSPTGYPAMPMGNGQVFTGGVRIEVDK